MQAIDWLLVAVMIVMFLAVITTTRPRLEDTTGGDRCTPDPPLKVPLPVAVTPA